MVTDLPHLRSVSLNQIVNSAHCTHCLMGSSAEHQGALTYALKDMVGALVNLHYHGVTIGSTEGDELSHLEHQRPSVAAAHCCCMAVGDVTTCMLCTCYSSMPLGWSALSFVCQCLCPCA